MPSPKAQLQNQPVSSEMKASRERSRHFRQLLRRNLALALSAILLLLPLTGAYCISIIHNQLEEVNRIHQAMSDRISDDLQKLLFNIQGLADNGTVQAIGKLGQLQNLPDYYTASKIQKIVKDIVFHYNFLCDMLVVFHSCVITGDGVYITSEAFQRHYSVSVFPNGDRSIPKNQQVSHAYWLLPSSDIVRYSYTGAGNAGYHSYAIPVAFCYYVPIVAGGAVGVWALASEDYLAKMIPDAYREGEYLRVSNHLGETLYETGQAPADSAWGLHRNYTNPVGTMRIDVFIPVQTLIGIIAHTIVLLLLYMAAAISVAFLLAQQAARRQFLPMASLLYEVENAGFHLPIQKNEMAFVQECFRELQGRNRNVLKELSALSHTLRRNIITLLMNGQTPPGIEGLEGFPSRFAVAYGCLNRPSEAQPQPDSIAPALAVDRMLQELPTQWVQHRLSPFAFAFLCPMEAGQDECMVLELTRLVDIVNASLPEPISIAISPPACGTSSVYPMLEHARMAMLAQNVQPGLIRAKGDSARQTLQFQNGMQLYQALVADNQNKAHEGIDAILRGQTSTLDTFRGLYDFLRNVIRFAAHDVGCELKNMPIPYTTELSPQNLCRQLYDAADRICSHNALQKQRFTMERRSAIVSFMRDNMGRYDLSVQEVCTRFLMSERAVHAAVHLETGSSFANTLLKLRLDSAESLLRETSIPVHVICETVGFNTISAFHKAFKRVYAQAPGVYRREHSQEGV